MSFIDAKASLVQMLGDKAAGRYRTIGYQPTTQAAETFSNLNRYVSVRFHKGEFPKSINSSTEDFIQNDGFEIKLTVSKSSTADISVIDDPNSSNAQREAAILAALNSDALVDESMDEFYNLIRQIIMTPANRFFQGVENAINDRWLESFTKHDLQSSGEYSVLHASIVLSCQTIEEVTSESGVPLVAIGGLMTVTLDEDEIDTYTETELEEEYE